MRTSRRPALGGAGGAGPHLHDLVCEDHHEAGRQVEDEDADLRSRVREEEVRVAVRERDRREAIQPQHERRRARLGRTADEAGLAVEAEDGHHSERDEGGRAGVPEVVGEPVDDGVGARDELQVLRLGVALLDNEGRDGGGRVRERDEHEDAGEEGEHHLHLPRLPEIARDCPRLPEGGEHRLNLRRLQLRITKVVSDI